MRRRMIVDCARKIDYLRLSVTDRCNLRCIYCMPKQGLALEPRENILTFEETIRLVRIFTFLGVRKIRLTGGEPLVRKGLISLIRSLVNIEGIAEVTLTTNGILLAICAGHLKKAGIKRINISLDTLNGEKFKRITGDDRFRDVIEGINKAKELSFHPLKLNVVVMRGINDEEIIEFVRFALDRQLILRFIEFMKVTPLWRHDYFISAQEIKEICEREFNLKKIDNFNSGPVQYYKVEEEGILGFITTEENNCKNCSRLRLTASGELKVCLYEARGLSLRELLIEGISDEAIEEIIRERTEFKKGIDFKYWKTPQNYMCKIGG